MLKKPSLEGKEELKFEIIETNMKALIMGKNRRGRV